MSEEEAGKALGREEDLTEGAPEDGAARPAPPDFDAPEADGRDAASSAAAIDPDGGETSAGDGDAGPAIDDAGPAVDDTGPEDGAADAPSEIDDTFPTRTRHAEPDGDAEAEEEEGDRVLFDAPPMAEQERMVEALLFASSEPLTRAQLEERLPHGSDAGEALEMLRRRYQGRGVTLTRVGPGWAFRTSPDLGFLMRREAAETRKLSRAAIETLAIIAYHQPVTRAEIEEIRGVSVSKGTIDLLIELDWIRIGRRRETPGRPVTFVITNAFLDHFGLESAKDLPGIKELRAAGLLDSMPPMEGGLTDGGEDREATEDEDTDDMFEEDEPR
jgi:segregation and condensation protein B